jgi:hypothetical protein
MSEMIERVAAAILKVEYPQAAAQSLMENGQIIVPPDIWNACREVARAAIEAMREPTKEMVNAGYGHPGLVEPDDPEYAWQLMISAALK